MRPNKIIWATTGELADEKVIVGTYDEIEAEFKDLFEIWHNERLSMSSEHLMTYDEYVSEQMQKGLREATDEEIDKAVRNQ